MAEQANISKTANTKFQEGASVLRFFRLLTDEEQRIAYAILEGMQLQKALDSQEREKSSA